MKFIRSVFLLGVVLLNGVFAADNCKDLTNSFLNSDAVVMKLDITRCIDSGDVFGAKITELKVFRDDQIILDKNDPKVISDSTWRSAYFEDLNRDGFTDIVLVSLPYSASVDYSFLLFDKNTQKFQTPILENGYGYEYSDDFILIYGAEGTKGIRIRDIRNSNSQIIKAEINEKGLCIVKAQNDPSWIPSEKLKNRLCQK